jgi:hypothetical protein
LLLAYTAPVGSASYDGLQLLATWAATNEETSQRVAAELRADTPQ